MTLLQVLRAMLLALALPLGAIAAEWQGTVVGVADGDTLTLLDAAKRSIGLGSTASTHPSARSRTDNARGNRWRRLHMAESPAQTVPRSIATVARYAA